MKKRIPLFLLSLLCLASCGETKLSGTYSFTMGKDQETHIGLYVDLTDDDYVLSGQTKGKKLSLRMDLPETADSATFDLIKTIINEGVSTYYNIDTKLTDDNMYKVNLGADIINEVNPELTLSIPEKLFNYGFLVYVDGKKLTMTLPVSTDDFKYQLAWYGLFVDIKTFTFEILDTAKLPSYNDETTRFGTHPTVDSEQGINEVNDMNNNFQYEFSNTKVLLRDRSTPYGLISEVKNPKASKEEIDSFTYYLKNTNGELYKNVENKEIYINGSEYTISCDDKGVITDMTNSSSQKVYPEGIYKDAFVFRDYHALSISLLKE